MSAPTTGRIVANAYGYRWVCYPGCGWSGQSHHTEGGNPMRDQVAALHDGERHLRESPIHTLDLREPRRHA